MAFIDKNNTFATAASVAHAAGTVVLGDYYDTGNDTINDVDDIYFVVVVTTEIITAGSAGTIQFELVTSASTTVSSSPTVHLTSASQATGATTTNPAVEAGGVLIYAELPKGVYLRYMGVLYIVGTTTTTAGNVDAFLTKGFPQWTAFPAAI